MSTAAARLEARENPGSFGAAFAWALARDMKLALRHPGETLLVVAFFVLVASLFPLAVGAEPQLLARIGPGVIWVCALLAAFLSLPALFAADYADGSLEQMALAPHPMSGWVAGKVAAHWLASGLPLTVLSPLLGLQYGLEPEALAALAAALALGTPVLSLLGAACTRAHAGRARRRHAAGAPGIAALRPGAGVRGGRGRRRRLGLSPRPTCRCSRRC